MTVVLKTVLLAIGIAATLSAQAQPRLQLQGQPYVGGSMKLHLSAPSSVGQTALLAYGLNPLQEPIQTGKGSWYIGSFASLLPLGSIPSGGRIDLPFTMPPINTALVGIPIVLQGYVPGALSNPATLPLDLPYLEPSNAIVLTSPNPQFKGEFGKYTAAGDLNGDGHVDLIIAAHKEDYLGVDMSGRVYVFWGPDFAAITTLSPPAPVVAGFFGIGLTVADLDGVPPQDLIVAETSGDPAPANNPAKLYLFTGGASFSTMPAHTIFSPGTGTKFSGYGFAQCTGDFDDDGDNDIAVGFSRANVSGIVDAGRIDVYLGPDFGTPVALLPPQPSQGGEFGARVVTSDVNGDGVADLIEASGATPQPPWSLVGSAHVFVNPGFVLTTTIPCPEPLGNVTGFGYGLTVSSLDGDSIAEIVVSDIKERVFVFTGPAYGTYTIVPKPPATQLTPGETVYGEFLTHADLNDDGANDLIIGDRWEGDTICQVTSHGLVLGALGPFTGTFYRIEDTQPACGDSFGNSIIPVDLDADGRLELVVGANFADDDGLLSSGHVTILATN